MRTSPQATVMNFLNEIAGEFPSAISLAAGRPTDRLFARLDPEALINSLLLYERHAGRGDNPTAVRSQILQYGRTAGVIGELVAKQLFTDDGVPADTDRIIITAGCQEALALCLPILCNEPTDVLLVCNPTYIGAAGVAQTFGITISALPCTSETELAEEIEQAVARLLRTDQVARALYLIPDFDNPTGRVLDRSQRSAILAVCARHHIVILEDNPYGLFRYDGYAIQPMAALDEAGSVIYLSTYSKTLSPAMRVGSATLPETLFGDRAASRALLEKLVQRKSFMTVNTSQITQAIVGGILLDQDCSLRNWVQPSVDLYRNNRDIMLGQLEAVFTTLTDRIQWNHPQGGFFLSLDLPFRFDANAVTECATNYGVIVMPMAFFAFDSSQDQRIRLAFSSAEPEQICEGVNALGRYVMKRIVRDGHMSGNGQKRHDR